MRKKVGIIGGGHVGECTAMYLAEKNIADIVLVDIIEDMPKGKGLDLLQAGPLRGYDCMVVGSNDFADLKGCDIVVQTAGLPRKPGMTREDLITKNADIIKNCAEKIKQYAPNAMILMVANPLDIMTYHAYKVTGFKANKVFGQAGILDSTRFRAFVAMELGISMNDVQALVLGGHGDTMVPLPRYTTVSGIPITELISKDRIQAISNRTRDGGGEIVKLLKTGSAYYAPAAATVEMVDAVISDRKRVVPISARLTGQYGINDLYIGVPAVLGSDGVEKIIELDLGKEELDSLRKSADTYKDMLKVLGY
ncbi:MAG: malate dehydrogenase [candidate division Zixibacteria bacterium CG_4_9_14_3_um_filter_46_8]|nr:MAG: malate dehydrogenase [candidate division Zixibacteria bacterium CG_4_9_14_3_um_filter_46_8]